ncbi:MAG: hypothetical protein IJH91_00700 [Mogibacterium sp.]|nr:hypothetical protein [Mogibacterium sp.]
MAMIKKTIRAGQQPTPEQIERIEHAAGQKTVYDEDTPKLTEEQLAELAAQARLLRSNSKRAVISLRVKPATLQKAKATGKGYTGFLSRLLDLAIDDPDMVRRAL